jgi:Uma2 family endonuclease
MALAHKDPRMNIQEYLELIQNDPENRYEYIDGYVYMMTGGASAHATIGANMCKILGSLLEDSPCVVYNSDAYVELSEDCYVCPDTTVSCDRRDHTSGKFIRYPRVVVEVLSPGTEGRDRGIKFAKYRACLSIQECLFINCEYMEIELFRRESGNLWTIWTFEPGDQVELASLDLRFSVDEVYKKVYFPEEEND